MEIACNYWRRPLSRRVGGVTIKLGRLFVMLVSPTKGDYDERSLWNKLRVIRIYLLDNSVRSDR